MCALDINRIGTDGVLIVFLFRAEMVNCSFQQLNFCLANNVVKFGLKCIDSLIFGLDSFDPSTRWSIRCPRGSLAV